MDSKIKICGLTRPEEADYLNEIHADFAGMVVFFPKSRRNISLIQAREIKKQLLPSVQTVAVTVSPSLEQIYQIKETGFYLIQIHGMPDNACCKTPGELAAFVEALPLPILKAFNVSDIKDYPLWQNLRNVSGFVFDAAQPGSGKVFDWSMLKTLERNEKLFMLAGGLTPENVTAAIACLHPDGVDVSSGVEYKDRPGKDPAVIQAFAEAVRSAK